jgi:hypothetical protein
MARPFRQCGEGMRRNVLRTSQNDHQERRNVTSTSQSGLDDGRQSDVSIENTRSSCSAHSPAALANLSKVSGSIRLAFVISSVDLGFEALYHELCELGSDEDRARHVKRRLNLICMGTPCLLASPQPRPPVTRLHNHKIVFRLSSREVGLEKLYRQLLALGSTFERNQCVRRWLFEASAGFASPPVQVAQPAAVASQSGLFLQPKQLVPDGPVVLIEAAPRIDQGDAFRKAARQKAMSDMGI